MYVITSLCAEACYNPPEVVTLVFWVGYFNSALNPLIYAYFNREFRVAFKKTLQSCCDFATRLITRRRKNPHDPYVYSNASSELQVNSHFRTDHHRKNDNNKRMSCLSEGESLNFHTEAVI
ncbi:octopamine receptor beta-1R-like [Agrilus planipennis]|uniref:Octopamine receptor beta-1R-like n=1 Tax=Agrilus planipennis TaxID=224129 RepID=A0A7F5RII2_AGRPL|nr:octopamine receptor beta-1R-like [Agrilus planipennis]